MEKKSIIINFGLLLFFLTGCSVPDGIDGDTSFLETATTEDIDMIFEITNDNSGNVTMTPTAEGATLYTINFGDGSGTDATVTLNPGEKVTHAYPEGEYTVALTANNIAGEETTEEFPLSIVYRAPENLTINTNGEMRVSASADYAKSFLVYYGDVENEVGTPMAVGEELPPHTYPATGAPFVLRVVALSGGEATTEKSMTLFGLPITFETPDVAFFGTFDDIGVQAFSVVENPFPTEDNSSEMVGKYTNGNASWSGTYSPLDIPVNFEYGKVIQVMVYNPDPANVGKLLNLELEWPVGASQAQPYSAILKEPISTSGQWEVLTFDFSSIPAIPDDAKFTQLVFRFNDSAQGQGEIFYMDNIIQLKE